MGYVSGIKWNDEKIKQSILYVKDKLEIDRMPTYKEITSFYGNYELTNAMAKRKGAYKYAEELGLELKTNCTLVGKTFEKICTQKLEKIGYEVKQMSQNFPYDLLINDCVKIDVKASHFYRNEIGDFYSFGIAKPSMTCDFYILICLDDADVPNYFVVPAVAIPHNKQVSIGLHSIYDKYRDRFDLINDYIDFYKKMSKRCEAM